VRKNNENIPLIEYLLSKIAIGPEDTAKEMDSLQKVLGNK
jgi:hypothetical protein